MELTGREVLTLLARLNGFSNVKRRVDQILWCVRMEREADKLIQYYRQFGDEETGLVRLLLLLGGGGGRIGSCFCSI